MTTFLDLPDDKLTEICEVLEDKDLWNLVQTSKRVRNLCTWILDNRQTAYINELLRDFIDSLMGSWAIGSISIVFIYEVENDPYSILIKQYARKNIPNIIPQMKVEKIPGGWTERLVKLRTDFRTLLYLNDRLVEQNYVSTETPGTTRDPINLEQPKYKGIPALYIP